MIIITNIQAVCPIDTGQEAIAHQYENLTGLTIEQKALRPLTEPGLTYALLAKAGIRQMHPILHDERFDGNL